MPTGHEKDGGGESLSEEQKLFLNFKPSFGTCFEKSFEVIVFCNAHADLGGFPLIQSLNSYHILSYQSHPVMSRSFLQLDLYASLSIHRFLAVHEGTALSGDLLEARVKSPAVGIFERFFKSR